MLPQSVITQGSDSSGVLSDSSGHRLYDWLFECHGLWHNATLIIPSFLFVLFLALQARHSFPKLSYSRSYIIISYYGCFWLVTLLNLAWCFFQVWECTSGKELAWNLLCLFTTSGMLFLEVSLLAFSLQGNNTGDLEALTRSFGISALVVGLDILLKVFLLEVCLWVETLPVCVFFSTHQCSLTCQIKLALYLFGFGIPIFTNSNEQTHAKWSLWVVHKLLLTAVYGFILYNSKWRERLHAKPASDKYVTIMLILNAIALFACGLAGNGAAFGFWLYLVTDVCYHAFYLPLLYISFLGDFFQEEDFHLKNEYYSEMKDAGFFEADWE